MKKLIILLVCLWITPHTQGADRALDSIFMVLDNTILRKQDYSQTKALRITILCKRLQNARTSGERFAEAMNLGSAYLSYQNDSAMHYTQQACRYAQESGDQQGYIKARIMQANILRTMGLFIGAIEILDSVSGMKIDERQMHEFYNSQRMINNSLRGLSVSFEDKDGYEREANRYRNLLLEDPYTPSILRTVVKIESLFFEGQYRAALEVAMEHYDDISPTNLNHDPGLFYFYLSDIYGKLGDHQRELFYLAKASIEDVKHASRSYVALRKLANYLYQSNDITRAFNYMKCHIDDAAISNDRFRLFESANMFLDINRAFQDKELEHKKTISRTNRLLTLTILLLLATSIYALCQYLRMKTIKENLAQNNETLTSINRKLNDSNLIKVESIRLYMEQHLNYLSQIEACKRKAYKIARAEGTSGLLAFIESSMDTQKALDDFYTHFDATLLSLYPNFIEEFNKLLRSDQQIALQEPQRLTPELRIFALIRLGITNSVDIARFSQYSLSTIYSYRTRMRARAIDREQFEKQVIKIGI